MITILILFTINIILILTDAALGYFMVPAARAYMEKITGEEDKKPIFPTKWVLTIMVTSYMLMNCIGYFRGYPKLLILVTALVIFDIAAQLYLRYKLKSGGTKKD